MASEIEEFTQKITYSQTRHTFEIKSSVTSNNLKMASKLIITLLGFALFNIFSSTQAVEIGGDLGSLLLIVGKLCLPGNHDDDVAKAFFDCYDTAPGKDLFVKCQEETFGFTLDTNSRITSACIRAYKMPTYAKCLKKEFTAAGVNQDEAVTKVNICQGAAVGLN